MIHDLLQVGLQTLMQTWVVHGLWVLIVAHMYVMLISVSRQSTISQVSICVISLVLMLLVTVWLYYQLICHLVVGIILYDDLLEYEHVMSVVVS